MASTVQTLTVKITPRLNALLRKMARQQKKTKSAVVRAAIEALADGAEATSPKSLAELAGDLIGCYKGSPDLASNPDYMRGFGE